MHADSRPNSYVVRTYAHVRVFLSRGNLFFLCFRFSAGMPIAVWLSTSTVVVVPTLNTLNDCLCVMFVAAAAAAPASPTRNQHFPGFVAVGDDSLGYSMHPRSSFDLTSKTNGTLLLGLRCAVAVAAAAATCRTI